MASRPWSTFALRLASSLTLWAVAFGIIFSGYEIGFALLISGLGLRALWEYFRMLEHQGVPCFRTFGMACGVVLLAGSFYYFRTVGPALSYDFELSVLLCFLLGVFARQMFHGKLETDPLRTMAYTLFGLLWVLWLFNFVTKIVYVAPRGADGAPTGHFYVLYLLIVTKFSDMGAYLVGCAFGKHPMAPHISPKKTWEGFSGALFFSLLGSFGVFALLGPKLGAFTWTHVTVLGLLLGCAAVIGDLAESLVKRSTGVKDSGSMLPGIGGALDLIDSLLFTGPLLFFYMRLVLRMP